MIIELRGSIRYAMQIIICLEFNLIESGICRIYSSSLDQIDISKMFILFRNSNSPEFYYRQK